MTPGFLISPIFISGFISPIVEEVIFRGLILQFLKRYRALFVLINTTVLFLLMQEGGLPLIIVAVGLICGVLMQGINNMLCPIIPHMLQNQWILANLEKII